MTSPLSSWFSATDAFVDNVECYIVGQSSPGRDKMVGVWGRDCNIVERSAWRVPSGGRQGHMTEGSDVHIYVRNLREMKSPFFEYKKSESSIKTNFSISDNLSKARKARKARVQACIFQECILNLDFTYMVSYKSIYVAHMIYTNYMQITQRVLEIQHLS